MGNDRVYFANFEHGVRMLININPYMPKACLNPPLSTFEHNGRTIEIYKTGSFKEKIHILSDSIKVTNRKEAMEIAEHIPVKDMEPSVAYYGSHKHGELKINLRGGKLLKIFGLNAYKSDKIEDIIVRLNPLNKKLTIYEKVLVPKEEGMETLVTKFKPITNGKKGKEILKKVELKDGDKFAPFIVQGI